VDEEGVILFEFVINPQSFAQTIENLFYVSFLVRDGKAAIEPDENRGGLLILRTSIPFISRDKANLCDSRAECASRGG
jgi:Nse4 C-terminal